MRKFIDLLESQLGYSERGGAYTKFGDWYGKNIEFDADYTSAPWCDMMLSWAAHKLGYEEWMGQFAWTVSHAKWFRKHDAWGRKPEPGAFVFYDWSGSDDIDRIDHVGIVTRVEGHTIYTIEGNIDGGVLKRKERDTSKVVGYGYPWRIKERLDRKAREEQFRKDSVDPVLPPTSTDSGLLQQTDSTLGALIPYSEVNIVQPPLAARAEPTAKPSNGAQQATVPTPQTQPAQPQARPQTTSSAATNADKAAKKGKHAKPATADTKAVTSEPLTPLVDASASHPSPALESPTLVGSALVAALALLAVAKTRHMRARPATATPAPAAPGRRRHRRPRRPAFAPATASTPVKATMVRRTTADATLTTGTLVTAGALAGAGRSAHPAADALLETVEPVSASRSAALGGSSATLRPGSGSGYGAGAASSADFFPVDPAATGPMPLHPDILAFLSEDASAAPLEPTAIHQGTPLEALGARRIVPMETTPGPATGRGRFVPLETAAAQWGLSAETIAARLALPPGTFAIPEATSRFDAFSPRSAAGRSSARAPETPHTSGAIRVTRYVSSEPWPAAESLPPDVAHLLRDAQPLLRDAQGLPREEESWDAFGGRPARPMSAGEAPYDADAHLYEPAARLDGPAARLDAPQGAYAHQGGLQGRSGVTDGLQGGHARTDDGLQGRYARWEGTRGGAARVTGAQTRSGRQDLAGRSGRQDLPGRPGRQDASSGGYRGRRRRSGHPVEEPATFSPDAAPRGRRHRGATQHRAEQPHHMDARRIDPHWTHPQPGDGHPGSHRANTHGSDAHRGDAHRAGGRWDVRQLEPRWSDQFAQDGPLRGRRHRSPAYAAAEAAPHRTLSPATPPLSAPLLPEASPAGRAPLGPLGAANTATVPAAPSAAVPGAGDRSPAATVADSPARESRRRKGRHRA
ncbi:CHAP domain-containing protein [Nonomuraea sp. NPDC050691]|uniref:CHAP domain-containing protein n=1 Tax=Nonomuraea sp. NPDC050691 TaxID=3155661 RepID=UPI00340220BB